MSHIIKSTPKPKKNAQSKDFLEIQNTQTQMKVTKESWDRMFHDYKNPQKCAGKKRISGCTVCDKLKNQHKEIEK